MKIPNSCTGLTLGAALLCLPATIASRTTNAQPIIHASAPAALTSGTLWDFYPADHRNPRRLFVTMNPNQTTVHVGDKLSFIVHVGARGYLILLERGVSGHVNLLFPASRTVADAKVLAGKSLVIPDPAHAFAPDAPGAERIKALLFPSKAAAAALLSARPGTRRLPYAQKRALPPAAPHDTKFVSFDMTFEVVPLPSSAALSEQNSVPLSCHYRKGMIYE